MLDTVPYLFCRSEEVRLAGMVWYSILKDTKSHVRGEDGVLGPGGRYGGVQGPVAGAGTALREHRDSPGRASGALVDPGAWQGVEDPEDGLDGGGLPARPK